MFKQHPLTTVIAAILTLSHAVVSLAQLEEVVVTAQKRAQSLQDVPISVNAMSQDKMMEAGIDRIENLAGYVPNLTMSELATGTNIYIRGIGSGVNPGFEQSAGMYVDGISYSRARLARAPFLDLQRVEVLRGPQPTLFGKNSIAGAVSMITAKPSDEFEGYVSGLYEPDHGELEGTLVLSGPLTDKLAGRLAVRYKEMDGFMENSFLDRDETDREETTIRGTLRWDATDNLSFLLKAESGKFDNQGRSIEIIDDFPSENPAFGGLNYSQIQVNIYGQDPTALNTAQDFVRSSNGEFSNNDTENITLTFDYRLGEHTLTGITGYLSYDYDELCDCDFSSAVVVTAPLQEEYEQFSQEFRLTSPGGETFDYIVGAFFQTQELDFSDTTGVPADSILGPAVNVRLPTFGDTILFTGADRQFEQDTDIWAIFGQVTWHLADDWRLTVGARYTEEDKEASRRLELNNLDGTPIANPGQEAVANIVYGRLLNIQLVDHATSGERKEENFTPLVTLQWDANDDAMLYATYSKGFKSGGYDSRGNIVPGVSGAAAAALADPSKGSFEYEEEEAQNFEIGAKTRWLDNTAELNMAFFFTAYDDLQVSIFDGSLGFLVDNAAEAEIMGFEADGRWAVTDKLTLSGSLAWLDFEFQNFPNGQCNWTERNLPSCIASGTISYEGRTNQYVADWSGTFTADYFTPIGDRLKLLATADFIYSDEYFPSQNLDPTAIQDSYWKINARLAFGSIDDRWEIAVLGRNLTDEEIITYANPVPLAQATFGVLSHFALLERERNVAVQAIYRF